MRISILNLKYSDCKNKVLYSTFRIFFLDILIRLALFDRKIDVEYSNS